MFYKVIFFKNKVIRNMYLVKIEDSRKGRVIFNWELKDFGKL